jgi:DNA-binding response OmpR family regulator
MAQAERSKGANVHFVAKIKNEQAPIQEFSWCLQIEKNKIYLAGSCEQSLGIMGRILGSNFDETLTRTEELILNYFCKNFDRAITREEFVAQIWKNSMVHPKSLNVHVSNIRKKLIGTETRIIPIGRGKWKLTQIEKGHC